MTRTASSRKPDSQRRLAAAFFALAALAGCGRRAPAPELAVTPLANPAPPGSAEPFLAAGGGRLHLSWLARNGEQVTFAYATYSHDAWSAVKPIAAANSNFLIMVSS